MEERLLQLEKEIQRLKDIEDIKFLMGKYFRCLDCKLWDEIQECFSEDCTTSYSDGRLVFHGVKDVVNFFVENMPKSMITKHNGHTPEISIVDEHTAKARWYLSDYLIITSRNWGVRGTAIYDIEYAKKEEGWKIQKIGYKRIFEERWNRENYEERQISGNMHDPNAGVGGAVKVEK